MVKKVTKRATEIRCFLGMDLADDAAQVIAARLTPCLTMDGQPVEALRPVPRRNWHLTLAFLGNRPLDWLAALQTQWAPRQTPATLTAQGVQIRCFPDAKGRVLALVLEADPGLLELKRQVDQLLCQQGFSPEIRPWRPHVTLGRFDHSPRHKILPTVDCPVALEFSAIRLFQSLLSEQGAEYRPLWSWPLAITG